MNFPPALSLPRTQGWRFIDGYGTGAGVTDGATATERRTQTGQIPRDWWLVEWEYGGCAQRSRPSSTGGHIVHWRSATETQITLKSVAECSRCTAQGSSETKGRLPDQRQHTSASGLRSFSLRIPLFRVSRCRNTLQRKPLDVYMMHSTHSRCYTWPIRSDVHIRFGQRPPARSTGLSNPAFATAVGASFPPLHFLTQRARCCRVCASSAASSASRTRRSCSLEIRVVLFPSTLMSQRESAM